MLKDADGDGLTNLVEYAFALNPSVADAASLPASRGGPVVGFTGDVSVTYTPDASRFRHVEVRPQYSSDGNTWKRVPLDRVVDNGDGSFTAAVPPAGANVFTRLKVLTKPPKGSTATVASVVAVQ